LNVSSRLCFLLEVLDGLCHEVPELADCRDKSENEGGMSSWLLPAVPSVVRRGVGAGSWSANMLRRVVEYRRGGPYGLDTCPDSDRDSLGCMRLAC
jgi:hypothetical protein